ncbi:hypothetical protein ACFYNA_15460 [Streptomyces sp. NPDC006640]|uniref:hypothetical protein n=1 Tax=Streptomyces sp. NPDC006640 TaxID=3364754 RepID=UPI0036BA49BC
MTQTSASYVAYAADSLLNREATPLQRATAELLNYVASTWDRQDQPLREHAYNVAAKTLNEEQS